MSEIPFGAVRFRPPLIKKERKANGKTETIEEYWDRADAMKIGRRFISSGIVQGIRVLECPLSGRPEHDLVRLQINPEDPGYPITRPEDYRITQVRQLGELQGTPAPPMSEDTLDPRAVDPNPESPRPAMEDVDVAKIYPDASQEHSPLDSETGELRNPADPSTLAPGAQPTTPTGDPIAPSQPTGGGGKKRSSKKK